MGNYRFHTPDGVTDILAEDCSAKRRAEQKLRVLFDSWGYQEIETPGLEFYDAYSEGSFVAQEDLCKLGDRDGRLLALRYDGTIPVARLVATTLRDVPAPIRISYIENMYRFRESGGGRQREFCQAGVELLGLSTARADAEVIALAIASALEIGIPDLQISIGQVEFFKGLMEEWKVTAEDADEISREIDRKDTVALEKMAERLGLSSEATETLLMCPSVFGTYEALDRFAARVTGARAKAAIQNVREVFEVLEDYDYLKFVSVDFGMLRGLDYYTGMIFRGFTYEVGFPIISGGRYDQVVASFGRDLTAVGFSLGVNLCMAALRRRGAENEQTYADAVIGYSDEPGMRKLAIAMAEDLRAEGMRVILDCDKKSEEELELYADTRKVEQVIFLNQSSCECGNETMDEVNV